nr:Pol polyprotein [Tanacetum cinerariifolium]
MPPLLHARAGDGVQKMRFLGQDGFEAIELVRACPTCGHECSSESSPMMTDTQIPPPATTVVNSTGVSLPTQWLIMRRDQKKSMVEPPTEGQSSNAQAVQAESLECKYKTEDVGTKKFVVARFLDYKMVDSKNVISQVQDLQVLIHDIHVEGMTLSETFQVVAIIEKLPPSWDNRLALKDTCTPDSAKANMIEHVGSSSRSNPKGKGKDKRKNDKKSKGKSGYLSPKGGITKKKFQETCYNYDQPGHHAAYCKMPKRVNPRQPNMVNDDVDMIATVSDLCAMISEGEEDVILKMTSEKELKLTNVLYVLEIRKNLVGYAMNGMFKLNVMVVKNEINKMKSSAYLIESSNVWHGRLRHVNFNSMRLLIKFNSMPNFHIDSKYKRKTCVEAKLTRTSFKSVKRKNKPLDMVHTDICDLKSLSTKGGNKYFITFIDDCIKYYYVYLLKSKDEAIDKFILYKTEVENQLGKKIKVVRSDRGCEYVSSFAKLCAKHGIRHEFTAPYSPQQNGIAERNNRTLKEMVTAMLISSGMSQDMWRGSHSDGYLSFK